MRVRMQLKQHATLTTTMRVLTSRLPSMIGSEGGGGGGTPTLIRTGVPENQSNALTISAGVISSNCVVPASGFPPGQYTITVNKCIRQTASLEFYKPNSMVINFL